MNPYLPAISRQATVAHHVRSDVLHMQNTLRFQKDLYKMSRTFNTTAGTRNLEVTIPGIDSVNFAQFYFEKVTAGVTNTTHEFVQPFVEYIHPSIPDFTNHHDLRRWSDMAWEIEFYQEWELKLLERLASRNNTQTIIADLQHQYDQGLIHIDDLLEPDSDEDSDDSDYIPEDDPTSVIMIDDPDFPDGTEVINIQ